MDDNSIRILLLLEEEEDDDLLIQNLLRKKTRKRRHDIFVTREIEGCFNVLVKKHLYGCSVMFEEYFRLTKDQFMNVLTTIEVDLMKLPSKRYRKPISAAEKWGVTLRYLATGESMRSLAFQFRISHNYLSVIIKETLKIVCKHLVPIYLPEVTQDILKNSATNFLSRWNFPCCGAIDGRHCRIRYPPNSGSSNNKYKKKFSMVLLAVVDADCKFICVDIGSYGKEGGSGIFSKSVMGKRIENGSFPFPGDSPVPESANFLPHFLVGDGGFKLLPRLMKPYPVSQAQTDDTKEKFNYRFGQARKTVDSAFKMLANDFRIFSTPIHMAPKTIDNVVMAACCLHNLMMDKKRCTVDSYEMPTYNLIPLRRFGGTNVTSAVNIRNGLKDYIWAH